MERPFHVKREKQDKCPICQIGLYGQNFWVRFHIRYEPPLVILACRFCNYTEWAIRNDKFVRGINTQKRVNAVLRYMSKFEIIM